MNPNMAHLGSESFAISGTPTEKLSLCPRSAAKVGAETGYETTGPFSLVGGL